jgi:lipoprotein signal peptidase
MAVGVIVGVFYFDSDNLINIGLRHLTFGAVANAIDSFYVIGLYIGAFFLGLVY